MCGLESATEVDRYLILLAFLVGGHRGLQLLRLAAGRCRCPRGADEVGDEVHDAEHGQQPVEVVEAAVVDCVTEPLRAALDERDERAAEEEAECSWSSCSWATA